MPPTVHVVAAAEILPRKSPPWPRCRRDPSSDVVPLEPLVRTPNRAGRGGTKRQPQAFFARAERWTINSMDEERGSLLPPGRRAVEPAIRGLMGTAREQAPRKRWHERASTLLVAAVAAILALGAVARSLAAVARSSGAALARPPDALDETTRRTSEVGTAWRADGGVTTTLSAEDFLAFDSVQTWLAGLGVDWATLDDDARLESVAARTCSDASRRRRGCHAERPRRRVAATPRPPRGSSVW